MIEFTLDIRGMKIWGESASVHNVGERIGDKMEEWLYGGGQSNEEALEKHMDKKILATIDGCVDGFGWPGPHKNVFYWYVLEGDVIMGLNESPSHGYTVVCRKAKVHLIK